MQRASRAGFPSFGAAFGGFGGLGGSDGLVSRFFGGKGLFDDPFFSEPAGGGIDTHMFGSSIFGSGMNMFGMETLFGEPNNDGFFLGAHTTPTRSRGPIIEELPSEDEREEGSDIHTSKQHAFPAISQGPLIKKISSDDEGEGEDTLIKENPRKHSRPGEDHGGEIKGRCSFPKNGVRPGEDHGGEIEEAVDYAKKMGKRIKYGNSSSVAGIAPLQEHAYSFHSSTVTYGGANGAYYTSSTTRRTGDDGVIVEESKEADTTSGRATHRISRGIHEKGHSLTRKLNNGRVETMQTLHNLNQDELPRFEEAWKGNARQSYIDELPRFEETWKGNARQHLPRWNQNLNMTYNGINRNGSIAQLDEPPAELLTIPSSEQQKPLSMQRKAIQNRPNSLDARASAMLN